MAIDCRRSCNREVHFHAAFVWCRYSLHNSGTSYVAIVVAEIIESDCVGGACMLRKGDWHAMPRSCWITIPNAWSDHYEAAQCLATSITKISSAKALQAGPSQLWKGRLAD